MKQTDVAKLPAGRHADTTPGLYLNVKASGARSWLFRCSFGGKRLWVGLGSASAFNLAQARARAQKLTTACAQGEDPRLVFAPEKIEKITERVDDNESESLAPSFKEFAPEVIKIRQKVAQWKNAKHAYQWNQSIESYAFPVLANKKIDEITRDDIIKVLEPIWMTKTETAMRLRGRLETIFEYAITMGHRHDNPARWKGALDNFFPTRNKFAPVQHQEALTFPELKAAIKLLLSKNAMGGKAIAFGALTAARAQEFTRAKWEEIDFDNAVWSVPPERRKDKKNVPHRVPLSCQALSILASIDRLETDVYIFASYDGDPINIQTPRMLLRRAAGRPCTMHGCRSTFRDWAAENGWDRVLAEKALCHSVGSEVERAYQRSDLLERRRELMQAWADALIGKKLP